MNKKKRAPRKKLELEWAEDNFGLPVPSQPPQAAPISMSATEFLRRQAAITGNPAHQCNLPEAAP